MSIPHLPEWLLLLALAALASPAGAAPDAASPVRERIARERLVIERETQAARAACAGQFAVTDCIDRVNAERRLRRQPLDRESAVLDDELRKRRAAERTAQIAQRQAARSIEVPAVSVHSRQPSARQAPASASVPTGSPQAVVAAHEVAASQAAVKAAQRATAAALRTEQAQAHRRVVEERNRARTQQREPAKPLPTAPAASR